MHTIVFDLDGTLADTSGDLIAAANVCFADMGIAGLSQAADQATALRGGRAMLRLGLSRQGDVDEALVDKYYPILLEAYGANLSTQTVFFEGALETVQALRDRGDRVAICTNKPEGLAEQLMRDLQARDLFHALIGADTLPVRKPDPAPYIAAVERAGGGCITLLHDRRHPDGSQHRPRRRRAQHPCRFWPGGRGYPRPKPRRDPIPLRRPA